MRLFIQNYYAMIVMFVLSIAISSPAFAETPATFDLLDVNQDGLISKSEAGGMEGLSSEFDKVDVNKDGKLDKSEFAAFVSK